LKILHGIPLVFGVIDGSYISIIAPKVDPKSYYCFKGFYSTLIQGIVDAKCMFWRFDYGWIGSIHDLVHEGREESDEGKVFAIQAYRLCNISDVALVSLSIQ
jgi:hypothetical protein